IEPRALSPAQASLLAGLIQAPTAYDPFAHPGRARVRQVAVMRSLVRDGFLSQADARAALARPLPLQNATVLAPVTGVDLAPGPAFSWWQLALGAAIAGVAAIVLVAGRARRMTIVAAWS